MRKLVHSGMKSIGAILRLQCGSYQFGRLLLIEVQLALDFWNPQVEILSDR